MKRIVACLIWLLIAGPSVRAQGFLWAKSIVSTDPMGDLHGGKLVKDGVGNMYMTNYFSGPVDFDPGPGTYVLASLNSTDHYIGKFDTDGNFIWVKQLAVQINGMDVDDTGSVYIAGSFSGTVDFDPGPGTYNLSASTNTTYIMKLDSAGNFLWVRHLGGWGKNYGFLLKLGENDDIFVSGLFAGTVDFDPGSGVSNETTGLASDGYLLRLDASGNFKWVYTEGTSEVFYIRGMDQDASDNTYFVSDHTTNRYLVMVDGNGNQSWVKEFDSQIAFANVVVANYDLFVCGGFRNTCDFDPGTGTFQMSSLGGSDGFISKFDLSGNFIWAKQFGGPGHEAPGIVLVDHSGYIYIRTTSDSICDFDPGPQQYNLSPTPGLGEWDAYIMQLYPTGTLARIWHIGNKWEEGFVGAILDDDQNLILSGYFRDTIDLDPGPGVFNFHSNQWGESAFLLKLSSTAEATFLPGDELQVRVYPNPTSGKIKVSSNGTITWVVVTDAIGRTVAQARPDDQMCIIDLEAPPGVYYITVQTDAGRATQKIVLTNE